MVEVRNYSLIECFRNIIFILGIYGLYVPPIEQYWKKLIYNCLVLILHFFSVFLYLILMLLNVFLNSNNLETLTEYLFFAMTVYGSTVKICSVALKRNDLRIFISNLNADIFHSKNEAHFKNFEYGKNLFYNIGRFHFLMCLLASTALFVSPIIDFFISGKTQKIRQPLELWCPFNIDNYFIYAAVYVYQIFCVVNLFWVTMALDILFYGLLSMAIAQLRMLNSSLKNITGKKSILKNAIKNDDNYWESLAYCVKHYKSIAM